MSCPTVSTRSAGGQGEGGASPAGVSSPGALPVPAAGEEPEADQPEEQLQAPMCEQHGGPPGGPVEETRSASTSGSGSTTSWRHSSLFETVCCPRRPAVPARHRRPAVALLRALPRLRGGRGEEPHGAAGGPQVQARRGDGSSEEENGQEAGPSPSEAHHRSHTHTHSLKNVGTQTCVCESHVSVVTVGHAESASVCL